MGSEFLARKEEIVAGTYRLGALLRRSARGAVYETEFGEGRTPAVIKVREAESGEAETLQQRPRNAAHPEHRNLLKIYATGSSVLEDVPITYVVMERAEESLREVLETRALSGSETEEMLGPVLEALGYLHKEGYAHSRLKPSNVLAVNDQVKLSSDSVVRVADGGSAAEDMKALGVLIVQALTRRIPTSDSQGFEQIPQPLADIARHCLDPDSTKRWTVEQVQARFQAGNANAEEIPEAAGSERRVPKWIYFGLAALVLIVILAAAVRNKESAPAAPVTQQNTYVAPAPPGAQPTAPVAPALPRTEPQAPPAASRVDARKTNGWSVIVGAYGVREPAEKWRREVARRWPTFEVSLIETQAEKTRYLVVLGKNLSEDKAEVLRQRAVDSGLPRTTYIKRLM